MNRKRVSKTGVADCIRDLNRRFADHRTHLTCSPLIKFKYLFLIAVKNRDTQSVVAFFFLLLRKIKIQKNERRKNHIFDVQGE
jgi:hypothetical protein